MKNSRFAVAGSLLLVCVIAALAIRPWGKAAPPAPVHLVQGEVYYTCPMHPSVISSHHGACPVCGMALVRKVYGVNEGGPGAAPGTVTVTAAQRVAANITTAEVRRVPFSFPVSAPGVLVVAEPGRSVVAARVRGRIDRLYVDRTGTHVRKGEPLLSLYSPELAAAEEEYIVALSAGVDSAAPSIAAAARRRLRERFGLTPDQIARLRKEGDAGNEVDYVSPISGTVVRKTVVEGEYVDEGMTLFELADLSRLWVTASVPEREGALVHTGDHAGITVEAYPGERFSARVLLVEPVLDAESRALRVRLEVPNPGGRLRPNMYARVGILSPSRMALVVPATAVLYTGEHPVVWVESSPGEFSSRSVHAGFTANGETEILHGLRGGEMVAVTGGFLIDSESQLVSPRSDTMPGVAPHPGEHTGYSM
ncbi:MAG TPA: efflux RND transporter periplasmic adaptor subunit [Bacteroidota bacterium]|nr:efflux RND transporter periplasmic adaptor subunit [Bacteroidota bacterium]